MLCPQCRTQNDDDYVFCVNCGMTIGSSPASKEPATFIVPQAPVIIERPDLPTQPTVIRATQRRGSWKPALLILAVCIVLVSAAGGYIAYLSLSSRLNSEKSVLPDHLGLFFTPPGAGATPQGIKQLETANLLESRDSIATDSSLLVTPAQPEFVLYADPAEVPVGDLKFIRLDTISNEGKVRYLDFQAAIIDNKPAMKRLRFAQPLSDGRYAFALLSGFANEGKHRLWPFEVRAGAPGVSFTQELTLEIKATPSPTPSPTKTAERSEPPVGATVAYLTRTDVWLRRSPALQDKGKVTLLKPRQKVFVIRYSSNSDTWEGITSNWAFVQTENGRQGWVFNAFLDHGK